MNMWPGRIGGAPRAWEGRGAAPCSPIQHGFRIHRSHTSHPPPHTSHPRLTPHTRASHLTRPYKPCAGELSEAVARAVRGMNATIIYVKRLEYQNDYEDRCAWPGPPTWWVVLRGCRCGLLPPLRAGRTRCRPAPPPALPTLSALPMLSPRYSWNWLKIRAFGLTQYDAILLLDSDAILVGGEQGWGEEGWGWMGGGWRVHWAEERGQCSAVERSFRAVHSAPVHNALFPIVSVLSERCYEAAAPSALGRLSASGGAGWVGAGKRRRLPVGEWPGLYALSQPMHLDARAAEPVPRPLRPCPGGLCGASFRAAHRLCCSLGPVQVDEQVLRAWG